MRLEIDTAFTAPPLAAESDSPVHASVDAAEMKSALDKGIKAAQAGDRLQARASLLRAVELDPHSESGWLWLASISEYPEELLGFLNNVLDINPENQRALEWKAATHTLLAKTFVLRGIDAAQENQKEFAAECFQRALEYDERNCSAWMWMASLADSPTVKISFFEKVLEIEPDNAEASAAIEEARHSILKNRLGEAKTAAVSGDNAEAMRILDEVIALAPNSIEAWTMRSHLADGFDERIRCFESILAIDPENVGAKVGRDSLLAIFGTAEAAHAESLREEVEHAPSNDLHHDKSPTEDLELPAEVQEQLQALPDMPTITTPEVENEIEKQDVVAEPFASFAEETPRPDEEANPADDVAENTEVDTAAADASMADEWSEPAPEAWSEPPSDPAIAMPFDELPPVDPAEDDSEAIVFEVAPEVLDVRPDSVDCPFCHQTNDPQAISCHSCMAVLTLSDLELLLANQNADKLRLRQAVEAMERQRMSRHLDSDELVTLGVGHLNLRNLQLGYSCLADAAKLNPNNVVLERQVNSLLIRLEEIKEQQEAQLKMPKGKSILVVDDSPTVRKLIAGKLEKCGHDVICANDGVEAMERLDHFVPDLILLDITMPRMDGYQVCKQIRSNPATKDVAVVMISGKDGFFDKVRGRMAGTTGYITKPFGPETLMKAVEMYLSGEAPELDDEV